MFRKNANEVHPLANRRTLSFAKTPQCLESRRVTMLQSTLHAICFKHILHFGERQVLSRHG